MAPFALALKGRVESEGGEAEGGQPSRIGISRLLLHAAKWVGNYDRGQGCRYTATGIGV